MSVTLDRFVRVLSSGIVVSDDLVTVRLNNTQQALAAVRVQLQRITQAGLEANPGFVAQLRTLEQGMAAAMQQPTNQAKCEALDPVKLALLDIAKQAKAGADGMLADAAVMRQKADEALAAVNQANQAVQMITDPAFRAPLAARLAGVQNNRVRATIGTRGPELRAAVPILATCVTDANAIAAEAAEVVRLLGERVTKLAAVNTALAGLSAVNATIAEVPQKVPADRLLAALTLQRDALANAAADQLARELSRVPTLLTDIATATATSNLRVAWANTKARRDVIRTDADEYEAVGKKEGVPALEAGAAKLKRDLTTLETLSIANPKAASDQFPQVETDHNKLKTQFKDKVAESKLLQKVQDLVTADPNCPEAQMQTALGTAKNGVDVFKARLLAVYNSPRFQTSPEFNLVTPGEAVAIYTYTTNDYKQMNGYLYNKNPLDPPDDPVLNLDLKPPTEDQIKAKNKQTTEALKKLPVWTGGITRRGDRGFIGDDIMFADQNTFAIMGFWSTDKKRPFPGKWQMFIDGKTGKNVAMMSAYPNEDEVLFPPGTKFKVTSRDETNPLSIILVLEEVP